jgi:hypothetical protein
VARPAEPSSLTFRGTEGTSRRALRSCARVVTTGGARRASSSRSGVCAAALRLAHAALEGSTQLLKTRRAAPAEPSAARCCHARVAQALCSRPTACRANHALRQVMRPRDVAASLCRRSATRWRYYTRRDSPHRRQGCCLQRRAQEASVACRRDSAAGCSRARLAQGAGRLAPGRPRAFSLKTRTAGLDMVAMAAARLEARSARVDTPQTSHSRCRMRGA